jgi:hypothetical protein
MGRPKTTRDEINIDLDGSIDAAIAKLRHLKKSYPDGRISLETDYEYGESYARLKLAFQRPMEPVEIEFEKWRDKKRRFEEMNKAAHAYSREGDSYPRLGEMDALKQELGAFAAPMAQLCIFDQEVVAWTFDGYQRRDGTWAAVVFGSRNLPTASCCTVPPVPGAGR